MLPKMYVLVRRDLAETYRIVQGSHALSQYAIDHSELFRVWGNSTIVYLAVPNLIALRDWATKLKYTGKKYSIFREPDLDGQETAIACYDLGELFKALPLAN